MKVAKPDRKPGATTATAELIHEAQSCYHAREQLMKFKSQHERTAEMRARRIAIGVDLMDEMDARLASPLWKQREFEIKSGWKSHDIPYEQRVTGETIRGSIRREFFTWLVGS